MKHCPLVMIEWKDSTQPSPAWQFLDDYAVSGAVNCISVGWLIHDSEMVKCLAPNFGNTQDEENLQINGVITIPSCCITKITHLKEQKAISF